MRIRLEAISKTYRGGKVGASDITMNIEPGVFGLIGPNGAGKTTLMKIMATVMRPTSGSYYYGEHYVLANPVVLRKVLGYLPQEYGLYTDLTGREFLVFIGRLKGLTGRTLEQSITSTLQQIDLVQHSDRKLGQYSGGMKQRLAIGQALLNNPRLLIVDEPTAGLDPEERIKFRQVLKSLAGTGDRTVILSTHIVSDLELLADRIALISGGQVLVDGTPDQLTAQLNGQVWEGEVSTERYDRMSSDHIVLNAQRIQGDMVRVRLIGSPSAAGGNLELASPTLEDAYLYWLKGVQS